MSIADFQAVLWSCWTCLAVSIAGLPKAKPQCLSAQTVWRSFRKMASICFFHSGKSSKKDPSRLCQGEELLKKMHAACGHHGIFLDKIDTKACWEDAVQAFCRLCHCKNEFMTPLYQKSHLVFLHHHYPSVDKDRNYFIKWICSACKTKQTPSN